MRAIVQRKISLQGTGSPSSGLDEYTDRLLKLIPAESIAVFTAIDGIFRGVTDYTAGIAAFDVFCFSVILAATPYYLKVIDAAIGRAQRVITSLSFVIYVMAVGGPFERLVPNYSPQLASVLMPLWVFIVPIVFKRLVSSRAGEVRNEA